MVDLRNLGGDPAGTSGGSGGGGGGDVDVDVDLRNIGGDPAGDGAQDTTDDDGVQDPDLRNIGGDPAGDADRQLGDDDAGAEDPGDGMDSDPDQPPGGGQATIEDPEPAPEPDPDPGMGNPSSIEDVPVDVREELESRVGEQVGFGVEAGEDFTITREDDTFVATPTQQLQTRFGARQRGAIGGLLGDPAGLTEEQVEQQMAERRGAIGPAVGDPAGLNERQAEQERARLRDVLEGAVGDPAGRPGTSEEEARQAIERELEEQLDTDLQPEDIDFQREGDQITGRLTPETQRDLQVQQEPLVQLSQGTPLESVFEMGEQFGARQAQQRRSRRERLFGTVGLRDEAGEFIEDIGLADERAEFESLQASAQAELASLRESIGEGAERLGAAARIAGVAPLSAGLRATDTPPDVLDDLPSPGDDPEAFAAAAAPVAALEPTPFGEVALGLAVGGAGALAVRERVGQTDIGPAEAAATAELPGLFPPEQTVPDDRGLFVPEEEVEPPLFDRPEFLPPTDPASSIQTGRLTRPELEQPQEAIGRGFFESEFEQPEEPIGRGFFPAEQDVPTTQAGSALQQVRETRERVDRERRRQRQEQTVPDEFIPDEPTTIGGGTGTGIGEAGEGATGEGSGVRVVFRPSPRSMELRRIETEEGGFRIDPEFTRFLGAQTLDAETGPELGVQERLGDLPGTDAVGGEFAAAAQRARQMERDAVSSRPRQEEIPGTDIGTTPTTGQIPLSDVLVDQQLRQPQQAKTVQATGTTTPGLGEGFPTETVELFEEPVDFPTQTVTSTSPPEDIPRLPMPEFDEDRRRPDARDIDDFEKEFAESVIDEQRFLEAGPAAEPAPAATGVLEDDT